MSVHIFIQSRIPPGFISVYGQQGGTMEMACAVCGLPEAHPSHLKPMPPPDISADGDESIRRKKERLLNEFRELS
jgi:hypothetical protein